MSLSTIVQVGIAGRRALRRGATDASVRSPATAVVRIPGRSMRGLETLLALAAIAAAIAIGLGQ